MWIKNPIFIMFVVFAIGVLVAMLFPPWALVWILAIGIILVAITFIC